MDLPLGRTRRCRDRACRRRARPSTEMRRSIGRSRKETPGAVVAHAAPEALGTTSHLDRSSARPIRKARSAVDGIERLALEHRRLDLGRASRARGRRAQARAGVRPHALGAARQQARRRTAFAAARDCGSSPTDQGPTRAAARVTLRSVSRRIERNRAGSGRAGSDWRGR